MDNDRLRIALEAFMARHGLNAHALSKKANIRPSTIYNFMSGTSKSLSLPVIEKIAEAVGVSAAEILGGHGGDYIQVAYEVGVHGKLYALDEPLRLERPSWLPDDETVLAAIASGDALRPMPGEWTILFRKEPEDPETLLGRLCLVRVAGLPQPVLREIRRGTRRGLYHLSFWAAAPLEDAEIQAAHLIVSMAQR
jgi:transcriptional regulator with XRE-family HTH domain